MFLLEDLYLSKKISFIYFAFKNSKKKNVKLIFLVNKFEDS